MATDATSRARRVAETMLAREGTGPAWGLEIEAAGEAVSRVVMTVLPEMLNGHGTTHGGMIFALADTAFAYACNSRNEVNVAQSASISYLSPAHAGERLVAEAREVGNDGRTGVYEVTVRGPDGRIVAVFQGLSRSIGGAVIEDARDE